MAHLNFDELFSKELPLKKYCILPDLYKTRVTNTVNELIEKIELLKQSFPLCAEVFSKILNENCEKINLLEDFLVIIPFQFIWLADKKSLVWFENNFNLLASHSPKAWHSWVNEIAQRCNTGHDVCDRFYSYIIHLYAAIYLIKKGYSELYFPPQSEGVDIIAHKNGKMFAIECKINRTSEKFKSYFYRIEKVFKIILKTKFILADSFIFPSEKSLGNLSVSQCNAIKILLLQILNHPSIQHRASLIDNLVFVYSPLLSLGTDIKEQTAFAKKQALHFFNNPLSQTFDRAAKQLGKPKYKEYEKIIFLGIQSDSFFLRDWTQQEMDAIKIKLKAYAYNEHTITVIFSEDAGFSIDGYL